jgi:hypothetical protein
MSIGWKGTEDKSATAHLGLAWATAVEEQTKAKELTRMLQPSIVAVGSYVSCPAYVSALFAVFQITAANRCLSLLQICRPTSKEVAYAMLGYIDISLFPDSDITC